jgi:hypothetical protein
LNSVNVVNTDDVAAKIIKSNAKVMSVSKAYVMETIDKAQKRDKREKI